MSEREGERAREGERQKEKEGERERERERERARERHDLKRESALLVLGRDKHFHEGACFGKTSTFFDELRTGMEGKLLPINSFQVDAPPPFHSKFVPPFPSTLRLLSLF